MNILRAAAALAIASAAVAAPDTEPSGATREQLDRMVTQLRANAEQWVNDQEIETATEVELKGVWLNRESVGHLAAVIKSIDPNTTGLYVINRLLRRLSFAKSPTIRAALPTIKDLNSRVRKTYKSFPELSDRQVKALKRPTSSSRVAREAFEQRRREKMANDRAIAKHNQMVYVLEKYTYRLMLLARSPSEDKTLAEQLVLAEKSRSAIWLTILDGMADEARWMTPQRGETIYKVLRPPAIELKMERRKGYVHRGKSKLREDDRSTCEMVRDYPGIRMLSTLNRIATAARMPALKVPKAKDVEKHHRELEKKRQAAGKRRSRSRN